MLYQIELLPPQITIIAIAAGVRLSLALEWWLILCCRINKLRAAGQPVCSKLAALQHEISPLPALHSPFPARSLRSAHAHDMESHGAQTRRVEQILGRSEEDRKSVCYLKSVDL